MSKTNEKIIVGEVRGKEAADLLLAMETTNQNPNFMITERSPEKIKEVAQRVLDKMNQ